uniref:G protein signaling modulator 1a n=1 Tax=Periophthalmus magnuspinnatus TaxID=409849 RepID=A0A3B4A6Q7_9GOBI
MAEDHKCEHLVIIEDGDQDQSEESETGQTTEGQGERAEGQRKGPNAVKAEEDQNENQDKHVSDGTDPPLNVCCVFSVVFSSMNSLQREEFFDLVATAQARRLNDQRAQAPVPKEELYSMILHTQAQGRLEDQRSRAPGPMDDEVFFSLLLRVQGGRMDEQRTELPCLLHT